MKIARVKDSNNTETYALISSDEKKLVTRNEIQEQTGIPIPVSIKEFMFNGWLDEVRENYHKLNYPHFVKDLDLLVPIPNPPKILCLAQEIFLRRDL
jgi:hypothetical protein